MVLTAVTVGVAFVNLGSLNFPVAIAHRHHQGDAGHPVLHAREVQQPPDEDGRRRCRSSSCSIMFGLTLTDYMSRGWYTSPRGMPAPVPRSD